MLEHHDVLCNFFSLTPTQIPTHPPTQIACTVYPVQRVSQDEESGQVTVELQSSLRSAVDTFTLNTPYQV